MSNPPIDHVEDGFEPRLRTTRFRALVRGAVIAFVVWTVLAVLFAGQFYTSSAIMGRPITWSHALGHAVADWYVFALLAPPVAWLGRHVRLEWPLRPKHLFIHLSACAAFMLAYLVLRAVVGMWQTRTGVRADGFFEAFESLLVKTLPHSMLVYWAVVAVQHVVAYQERAHERERRAAELEQRLTAARLQALQMQLNPHFLFNTLNAISCLMHQDVDAADRMLVRLSELLRRALDTRDLQEIPLREELAFLDRYLEIEQTRFGARLTIERAVDDGLLDALVPNLLLQPLVENAIKHGVERQLRAGLISVAAKEQNGEILLTVRDNGPGLDRNRPAPVASKRGHGIGLSNTRRRLEQLYGSQDRLIMRTAEGGGTEVLVRVPLNLGRRRETTLAA